MKIRAVLVWCFFYNIYLVECQQSPDPGDYEVFKHELGYCEVSKSAPSIPLILEKTSQVISLGNTPTQRTVRFYLYTRLNPNERQVLSTNDSQALFTSNFNNAWPTRFSLHGWNNKPVLCSQAAIKDAYLANGDFNVIIVDWSDYALDTNYVRVVGEIFEVAEQITEFTRFLHRDKGVPYADMYLIGHSLGAHVAASAGKLLKPNLYGVIYALDAAGPLFEISGLPTRLSPSDAMYVEAIHTDILVFGLPAANIAHANFYPNWGLSQPHCPNATAVEPVWTCNHFGALYYFVESIHNKRAFGAIECENYLGIQIQSCHCPNYKEYCEAEVYMGGEPAIPKMGIYYLSTHRQQPYGYGPQVRIKPVSLLG